MWKPAETIVLTSQQKTQLKAIATAPGSTQKMAARARIALLASEGRSNNSIAKELNVSRPTVIHWRKRYLSGMIQGLSDAPREGRPKELTDNLIQAVVEATQFKKPNHATHWTTRTMAKEFGLSHMSVKRIWNAFNLKPHRTATFKISTDPKFVEKVRDVVGLYLNPPDKALVLCVDEKTQIQALDHSQPLLPLRPGQIERRTHDYVRHGTTSLFAALNVTDGSVIAQSEKRHRHTEFLAFLRKLDHETDPDLDVHLVLDNYCTHKHKNVREWLATHSRFHVHFTPTGASWLNQVEIWFNILTQKRLRRGVFKSLKSLTVALREYVYAYNKDPKPFVWTKSANQILAKSPHCKSSSVTQH
jgi:transposase